MESTPKYTEATDYLQEKYDPLLKNMGVEVDNIVDEPFDEENPESKKYATDGNILSLTGTDIPPIVIKGHEIASYGDLLNLSIKEPLMILDNLKECTKYFNLSSHQSDNIFETCHKNTPVDVYRFINGLYTCEQILILLKIEKYVEPFCLNFNTMYFRISGMKMFSNPKEYKGLLFIAAQFEICCKYICKNLAKFTCNDDDDFSKYDIVFIASQLMLLINEKNFIYPENPRSMYHF